MMQDKDFIFSLYPNDLVYIRSQKGISVSYVTGNKCKFEEVYGYFNSADISTASIQIGAHDDSFMARGIGIQNLDKLDKYKVDILGNRSLVKNEARKMF